MNVGEWVAQFPRDRRKAERARIAAEVGVLEVTVRSWANGHRQPRGEKIPLLAKATEGGFRHYFDGAPFVTGLVGISGHDQRPEFGYVKAPARARKASAAA